MSTNITVNGEEVIVPQGTSVAGLLEILKIDGARVAVELDRAIVRQREWDARMLEPGARLEIVQFVGGG